MQGGSVSGSVRASTGIGSAGIETGSGVGSFTVSGSEFGVISGSGSVTRVVSGSGSGTGAVSGSDSETGVVSGSGAGSGMGSFSDRDAGSVEETSLIALAFEVSNSASGLGSYFAGSAFKTCKN